MIRPNTPRPDPILEPVLAGDLAQRLIDYHPPAKVVDRIQALRMLANEGALTKEDREEYERLIQSMDLFAILQAKARDSMNLRSP